METCEELRPVMPSASRPSYSSGGKYGFSDRVIDGMSVTVNSVIITFRSPAFQASFQISRLLVESRTPSWKKEDLRLTRIKHPEKREILLFKQIEWQVLRIEAKAVGNTALLGHPNVTLTPLRLITNQACCRITVKKKLNDCSIIGTRLVMILDDLLWVLTDAQLIAALHFMQSLKDLVQRATQRAQKLKAVQKLASQSDAVLQSQAQSQYTVKPKADVSQAVTPLTRLFNHYDVIETSCHLYSGMIELHLCDDLDPKGRSGCENLKNGGALQISLQKLVIDYYPYHCAMGSRDHWLRYNEPSTGRNAWVQQLLSLFQNRIQAFYQADLAESGKPGHAPVFRAPPHGVQSGYKQSSSSSAESRSHLPSSSPEGSRSSSLYPLRKSSARWSLKHMMSCCVILRIEDFSVHNISTSSKSRSRTTPGKFLASDRTTILLPPDMKAVHLEMTYYYFPGDLDFPVPSPYVHMHLGPVYGTYDSQTVLWLNAFFLNIQNSMVPAAPPPPVASPPSVDVRFEALMSKVIFPCDQSYPHQLEWPQALHLQASRIVATNRRLGDHASKSHLSQCLETFSEGTLLYENNTYPWRMGDFKPIPEGLLEYVIGKSTLSGNSEEGASPTLSNKGFLNSDDKIVWSVHLDPFWADFVSGEMGKRRPQTFIDALPLTIWLYGQQNGSSTRTSSPDNRHGKDVTDNTTDKKTDPKSLGDAKPEVESADAKTYMVLHVHSIVNVQMTHHQYIFLLRVLDTISETNTQLANDVINILGEEMPSSMCIAAFWPRVDLSLLLQNIKQYTATSGSDDLVSLLKSPSQSEIHLFPASQEPSLAEDASKKEYVPTSSFNEVPVVVNLPKSHSDSVLSFHSSSTTPPLTPPADASCSTIENTSEPLQRGIQSSRKAVKKGLTNIMASIDSVMTRGSPQWSEHNEENSSVADDDTLSVRSDFSSDSDQMFVVGLDTAGSEEDINVFPTKSHTSVDVEIADDAQELSGSNNDDSSNSEKKNDIQISRVTLKFEGVETVVLFVGASSSVLLKTCHLEVEEDSAISWESFQNHFSSKSRSWKNSQSNNLKGKFKLILRFDQGSAATSCYQEAGDIGYLTCLVQNIDLDVLMSSCSGIGAFLKDEIVTETVPSRILIDSLKIKLKDDQFSSVSTQAQPLPMCINLPGCLIERTKENIIRILPLPPGVDFASVLGADKKESGGDDAKSGLEDLTFDPNKLKRYYNVSKFYTSTKKTMDLSEVHVFSDTSHLTSLDEVDNKENLSSENEKLRLKLTALIGVKRENELLKEQMNQILSVQGKEEIEQQLVLAQDEIRRLEEEKRSLMETMQVLQEELNKAELEKQRKCFSGC
ncbi:UHRF1-binding protein 1-like [Limulus polyphemus]|uniref:UHRF1-binding protein 1-like n=1 Tax=Limulus polyphemus TaxID=6850 RepID=A0ABM1TAQ0_LIMPO|nr:UHRF1-binding protein 1-like [Limulus polyphemus]